MKRLGIDDLRAFLLSPEAKDEWQRLSEEERRSKYIKILMLIEKLDTPGWFKDWLEEENKAKEAEKKKKEEERAALREEILKFTREEIQRSIRELQEGKKVKEAEKKEEEGRAALLEEIQKFIREEIQRSIRELQEGCTGAYAQNSMVTQGSHMITPEKIENKDIPESV
eukprot:TRINITY_DN1018_c0_g1_i2.p1 TRINITY_DN1018_c0_g1~~TRINITY_DN1018_c0_g1_i2.p1  ORF type:complete len:169 (-),score=63.62 TRINITY_DN1018_c0_g1_i2:255-761(-)